MKYWFFSPAPAQRKDSPERKPTINWNVFDENNTPHEVCLFCDENNRPEFLRLRIDHLTEKLIPESSLPFLQTIKEHALTCLKITYSINASYGFLSEMHSFFDEGQPHELSVEAMHNDRSKFDTKNMKDLFVASVKTRELLRLYADGINDAIPLQYRFLSLFKILESKFGKYGKWDTTKLGEILNKHIHEYNALGFKEDPIPLLHDLRDKCAHIRTGKSEERSTLGVSHLNYSQAVRVEKALPFLRKIAAITINDRADGAYEIKIDVEEGAWRELSEEEYTAYKNRID